MKHLTLINPENVTESEGLLYTQRIAVRAVVFDSDENVALLHAINNNYFKLPGGGVEESEDFETALERECIEEIGTSVKITEDLGSVTEYRKRYNLRQISYCYLARVQGEKGIPNLTESEIIEGFETLWVPLEEALRLVSESKPIIYEGPYMVMRDTALLQAALENLIQGNT